MLCSRPSLIDLTYSIINDTRPLPPKAASQEEDDKLFENDPWVCQPIHTDYGINIMLGEGVFVNWNSTFVDTCPIRIGARTLIGPNCSFYSGSHPLDPAIRNGLEGPEHGQDINIGEDCWLGGNVIVLPGVTIGKGCTVGAGSVVTKVRTCYDVRYQADSTIECSTISSRCRQSGEDFEEDRDKYGRYFK